MTDCIQAFLPTILKTGTLVDQTDIRLNKGEGSSVLDNLNLAKHKFDFSNNDRVAPEGFNRYIQDISINEILGFEIFPALVALFCLNHSLNLETKLLNVLTRYFNQRLELAEHTTKMLVLFDENNINIFTILKPKIKLLAKNIDEGETWLNDLNLE